MTDSFSALHPALTFCYFAAVLLLTMFVLHPVFLALSLLGALGYCAQLRGWRSLWRTLGRLVPFLVLMAALNALFNHAGVTMLFYLPNGNPVTREALCYGAAAAAMFAAVILWFQCCSAVMTAEMVVESLEDRKIQLLDCPFVEGAVIAAIEAAGGTPLAAMQDKVEASRDRKL